MKLGKGMLFGIALMLSCSVTTAAEHGTAKIERFYAAVEKNQPNSSRDKKNCKIEKLKAESISIKRVKITWKNGSDITKCKVYQKILGNEYKLVKTTTKESCKLSIQTDKRYRFKVVPYYRQDGKERKGEALKKDYFCNKITLSAAGDCTLGVDSRYNSIFNSYYSRHNPEYFLKNVKSVFGKDDLTIVNFEGTLTTSNARADKTFTFKGKSSYTKILTAGSVEVVNMANNHTMDFGLKGMADTKSALKKAGIAYCIESTIAYKTVDGTKVAFLGYHALSGVSKSTIKSGIQAARKKGAELVIVSFHWGIERDYYPNTQQKNLAHYSIEQGANLVLGHHPHVLQGVEAYKGRYIVYSLGNFCFGGNSNPKDKDTMIFQQSFYVDSNGRLVNDKAARVIACSLSGHSGYNDFQPQLLNGSKKTAVINKIKKLSANMNVKIDAKGNCILK